MEKKLGETLYPIEEIPNEAILFYRIHTEYIDREENDDKKKIKPSAFDPQPKPHGTEMSVGWNKYCSAQNIKDRARKPEKNGVVSFNSTKVRESPPALNVAHRPTSNRDHSIIFDVLSDVNDPEIRIKLRRICQWEIPI